MRWEEPWQRSALLRSELSGKRETTHQGKGTVTHPACATKSGSTAGVSDWPHGPSGRIAFFSSSASQALQTQVRGRRPWNIPCSGIVGRAALAALLHCTSPIPAVTILHLGAPTSGHFLSALVSSAAGNYYPLLF